MLDVGAIVPSSGLKPRRPKPISVIAVPEGLRNYLIDGTKSNTLQSDSRCLADRLSVRTVYVLGSLHLWGVAFAHHFLVQFPDACLRQGFYEDDPIRDAVAGNNALFDKALKMGPDLLFADLMAGLC